MVPNMWQPPEATHPTILTTLPVMKALVNRTPQEGALSEHLAEGLGVPPAGLAALCCWHAAARPAAL